MPVKSRKSTASGAARKLAAMLSPKPRRMKHVTDETPGIRRLKRGTGFAYVHPNGSSVRSVRTLSRIRHLVIPPAWKDVWICSDPNGHLQATGHDARGRKQYR